MKLSRIIAIPFALAADVVTLGKLGDGSYTSDLFTAERREQQSKETIETMKAIAELIRALK
jgi:hypothetical protein